MSDLSIRTKKLEEQMDQVMNRMMEVQSVVKESSSVHLNTELGSSSASELYAFKVEMLKQLRSLRDVMSKEGVKMKSHSDEHAVLREENDKLKKEVERLNYRIKHLHRNYVEPALEK